VVASVQPVAERQDGEGEHQEHGEIALWVVPAPAIRWDSGGRRAR
jgi:hypothetical protein